MATVFAIYCATDGSLTFYKRDTVPSVNQIFEDKTVSAVYTGFDTATYTDYYYTPWYGKRAKITSVIFADEIAPLSTAYWFYDFDNEPFAQDSI